MLTRIPYIYFLCLLFCILAFPNHLQSQGLIASVREISEKEGLIYREIFCSHQDSRGFLWLGTSYGLIKYDGHTFTYFTKEKDGLASNAIHQILEDESGMLWLADYELWRNHLKLESIFCFNAKTGATLKPLANSADWKELIAQKNIHRIAASSEHRINFFDKNQDYYPYVPGQGLLPKRKIQGRHFDILQNNPISYYSEQSPLEIAKLFFDAGFRAGTERVKVMPDKSLAYAKVMHQLSPSNFLVADLSTPEVLFEWSRENWKKPLPLPYSIVDKDPLYSRIAYRETDRSIWYGSRMDFFVYLPDTGDFIDFKKKFPVSFGRKHIHDIHFGDRGQVFVSTTDGFYILTIRQNPFSRYLYNDGSEGSSQGMSSCRTIYQWGDSLVIAHNPNHCSTLSLSTGKLVSRYIVNLSAPAVVAEKSILSVENSNTLVRYWPHSKRKMIYPVKEEISWPWSMHLGKDSLALIGTYQGIWTWKEGSTNIERLGKLNEFSIIDSVSAYQFLDLSDREMMLATSNGIFLYNWEKGATEHYWTGGKGQYHLPFDDVLHILPIEKKPQTYWLSTMGGGLIYWNRASGKWQQFTTENGLPTNIVYAAYADGKGTIWMPTYSGIVAYDPQRQIFQRFSEDDGITHNEFNRISHYQAPDGRLYFGGLNGVTAFYPADLKKEHRVPPPPIYITSLHQFDEKHFKLIDSTAAFHASGSINIQPNNTYSMLTVALLNYDGPERVHYDFRLEGRDNDWRPMLGNKLELVGMPYGKHLLTIRGHSTDNQYPPQTLQVPVEVLKPIYLQWWFIAASILCLIGAIFLFFKEKTRRLARQKVRLKQEVERRTLTILAQQQKMAADRLKIQEQAAEIKKLGQVLQMSQFSTEDAKWLKTLEATIQDKMSDPQFKAQDLATAMHLSRTQFHRKLKQMTSLTPGTWLQETRLQKAKELLENNTHDSIKAVAYEVGINPSYFAEAYRKRFGKLPSEC